MTKPSAMTSDFATLYAKKRTDELLRLAEEKHSLNGAARNAFDTEMQRRGLVQGGLTRLEAQDHEDAPHPAEESKRISWFLHLLRTAGIFVAAAILAAIIADRFLKWTNPALAETAGELSLKAALALGFLGSTIGQRIVTLKRTMIAAVIFSVALFAWFWVSLAATTPEKHADVSTNAARYDGSGFSMTIPVGSTRVQVKRETKELGGQQVTESWYDFRNEGVLYTIAVGDFSDHAGGTPEEAVKSGFTQAFDPGYHITNSAFHLGTLPAVCAEIDGATGGRPAVAKACAAYSTDRKRSWMVVVAGSSDRQTFPLAQIDAFMDSIQIN